MATPKLTLEASLYGRALLRFQTGLGWSTDTRGIEADPQFWRLTGAWSPDTVLTPGVIDRWLTGLRPQNGARSAQRRRAVTRFNDIGIARPYEDQGDIVWATPGFEYPGAVTFRSLYADGSELAPLPITGSAMNDETTERLLNQVVLEMRRGTLDPRMLGVQPVTSSGSLPKFAVHRSPADGNWYLPSRERLSTHIVKQEDRGDLPGEAAVESVCQRTLRKLNLRAARTRASLIGSRQVIISERSDRRVDEQTGKVIALHQEEWACACGLDPDEIMQRPQGPGGWKDLRGFLAGRNSLSEAESEHLWTSIAAMTLLGHRDLHRRNVGIRYSGPGEPLGCEVAPWYDVASVDGQRRDIWCAMGMLLGGRDDVTEIGEAEWVREAQWTNEPVDIVLGIVREVARTLPDAVAEAMREAHHEDEWRDTAQATSRLDALAQGTQRRARAAVAPTRGNRLRTPPDWLEPASAAIRNGRPVTLVVSDQTNDLSIVAKPSDDEQEVIGTVRSVSRYLNELRKAGVVDPDDVPCLERTLERKRRLELERARERSRGTSIG